ncbi:MAG TPA: hypothetical protein VEG60_03370 [Candidatus Binatia bacterium]|nr:hypothetical protein [Candidatus Binatia bacterium]
MEGLRTKRYQSRDVSARLTKFELMINLKAAQQIGVNFPEAMLKRADKVMK